MGLFCACPSATALTAITAETCIEGIGQVQKLLFQRYYLSGTTRNKFTIASADPDTLASWTAAKGASDGGKVVVSPYIIEPTMEGGEPNRTGGGNASLGGVETVTSIGAVNFNFRLENVRQWTTVQNMRLLSCENLGVYFINEHGQIIGETDAASSPTEFYPFRVLPNTFFVGAKLLGGFDAHDRNLCGFGMPYNWANNLYVITPADFNALTQL